MYYNSFSVVKSETRFDLKGPAFHEFKINQAHC